MISLESIVNRQIRKWELEKKKAVEQGEEAPKPKPVITVSRQRGSRGSYFAEKLAERLDYQLFHREIIDFICRDSGSRRKLIESLDEHVRPQLQLWLEGILKGRIVDTSDYMQWLVKSIFSIASHGGAVIVGRGANFILKLNGGFHIRIVAPRSCRISNLIEYAKMTVKEAEKEIENSDRERKDYIHKNFDCDIDDATAYDLILNTAYFDIESALDIAEASLYKKMENLEKSKCGD